MNKFIKYKYCFHAPFVVPRMVPYIPMKYKTMKTWGVIFAVYFINGCRMKNINKR